MIHLLAAIILSPLLLGIINKTKAFFAGRVGSPLLQLYYDLWKLIRKNFIYSQTTTWIFRAGPIINLSAALIIISFISIHSFRFEGDFFLVIYLFALMRFFTVISALDTGSAFEGMGSAREILYAIFSELAFITSLITLTLITKKLSFGSIFEGISQSDWSAYWPTITIISLVIFILMLLENSRIPFDDPNTHLELTMIHEVMVLDHSSFDFAIIQYASALKLWIWSYILSSILFTTISSGVVIPGILLIALIIGIVESTLARFKLIRIPHFIFSSFALSLLALFLMR